eukprot:766751-Hanusia_phi.AAC.21
MLLTIFKIKKSFYQSCSRRSDHGRAGRHGGGMLTASMMKMGIKARVSLKSFPSNQRSSAFLQRSSHWLQRIMLLLCSLSLSDSTKGPDCACLQWSVRDCLQSCRHWMGLGGGCFAFLKLVRVPELDCEGEDNSVVRHTDDGQGQLGNRTWICRTKTLQGRSIKLLTYNILAE